MSWNTVNWGCLIVLSFFSLVENIEIDVRAANIKQQTDIAEPILADVMKNITRVNTMLQDLIKNYEKLEKISKAQSVERDSTETEVEALFDSEIKKKEAKRKSTTTAQTHKAYATAMFFEERDPAAENKNESQDTKSSSDSAEGNKEKQQKKKKYEDKEGKRTVEKRPETKSDESEVENKAEDSFFPAVSALKNFIKDLSDEPASRDSGEAIDKNEFSISTTPHTTNTVLPGFFKLYSEEHTLPEGKSHLEPRLEHNEIPDILRRVRENSDENSDGETIIIGTPEKNTSQDKQSNEMGMNEPEDNKLESEWSLSETESLEEAKIIQHEEVKTNVLRQAYGDACLKLVVRKCYRACKSVIKDVCNRRRQCPSSIRGAFKTNAVRGCKDVFHNHNHSVNFRMHIGRNEDEVSEDFQDLTREGYLSMACFPDKTMTVNEPVDQQQNVTIDSIDPKVKSMNILRDRYEAACQEESSRKCHKACTNAAKKACDVEKCSKRRTKEFGSACKKRCKQNYGVRDRKSKESSSSSSDSDSDKSGGKDGDDNSWG